MRRSVSALAVAALVVTALMTGPGHAAKKKPVCYEQGCTGDKCIFCTR